MKRNRTRTTESTTGTPAIGRRAFLKSGAAVAAGFTGLRGLLHPAFASAASSQDRSYGDLVADAKGVLDLPKGFTYQVVSRVGDEMEDGFLVPGAPDGMATFLDEASGLTIVIRNHEMSPGRKQSPFGDNNVRIGKLPKDRLWDSGEGKTPCIGGTTTFVFDTSRQKLERQFLSLAGTHRNCAGGPTPWGSWVSCEETVVRAGFELKGMFFSDHDHGYNFEVPATLQPAVVQPVPLKAMGRFNHEAIAVDPKTSIVYQTEDRGDGLIYRFIPAERSDGRAKLAAGGRLQALAVKGSPSLKSENYEKEPAVKVGERLAVEWVDLDDVESPSDDLRYRGFKAGAARFARGEGMWFGNGDIYFACTSGGRNQKGQIWKYTPSPHESTDQEATSPGRLELFIEPNNTALIENADNLTIAPNGDLFVCEDRGTKTARIVRVTPSGQCEPLAAGHLPTELAGATFSPDGSTLFFNLQKPGLTVAVTGPWA